MTTNPERKKRNVEPAVTVERLVRAQLRAMGCARFDLGVRRDGGEMVLREGQGAFAVAEAVKWLRHENAEGAHVYIRPAGVHSLSLLDDLTAEAIERMKAEGFEPAVVVETSPHNFQVWLNHGEILSAARSTAAAKQLAERFGRRSVERGLAPFRTTGGLHQSETRAAAGIRAAAVRTSSVSERPRLFQRSRVSCRHREKRRVRNRAWQGIAPVATPTHRRRGR